MPVAPLDTPQVFGELFNEGALLDVFTEKFAKTSAKGVDRVNGFQFVARAQMELSGASGKCLKGTYRFSPYLENLKLKGRDKKPRLIAIATIRDRVVLNQLNKLLAFAFPECVPKNIANSYVREISADLATKNPAETFVSGSDIRQFYDAIGRKRLLDIVSKRLQYAPAMNLVRRALEAPTVPRNSHRKDRLKYRQAKGIAQGLAVSNILAAIYLNPIDVAMKKLPVTYYRYVDDVLMYGSEEAVKKSQKSLTARLRRRGLTLHPVGTGKGHLAPLIEPFGYLGYYFKWPAVTVRETTIERLLQTIAAKFSDYRHNKPRRLARYSYLTEPRLAEIFLLELNERITGAISEKRRYGWIAYFSQINDLSLLYRLDDVVDGMFQRSSDFNGIAPTGLKKFRRAYFEMKFNPYGGYIRNYDKIVTRAERLSFLVERGRIGPGESLTDEQINSRYESYRQHILAAMHADEGVTYG